MAQFALLTSKTIPTFELVGEGDGSLADVKREAVATPASVPETGSTASPIMSAEESFGGSGLDKNDNEDDMCESDTCGDQNDQLLLGHSTSGPKQQRLLATVIVDPTFFGEESLATPFQGKPLRHIATGPSVTLMRAFDACCRDLPTARYQASRPLPVSQLCAVPGPYAFQDAGLGGTLAEHGSRLAVPPAMSDAPYLGSCQHPLTAAGNVAVGASTGVVLEAHDTREDDDDDDDDAGSGDDASSEASGDEEDSRDFDDEYEAFLRELAGDVPSVQQSDESDEEWEEEDEEKE